MKKTEKQDPRAALSALAEAFADETTMAERRAHDCRLDLEMLLREIRWGLDMLQSRVERIASGADAIGARDAIANYLVQAGEAVA